MSDIASHHAAHDGQQWKELCRAALAERDPWRLLEGIDAAHNAVLDRIQDRFPTKPLGSEQSDVEPVALH
jgi:hypothetical protein